MEFEMKRFMIFLVLVVACVAGLGFYRGWFQVASETNDDKRNVTFTADPSKIKDDEQKVVEKVKDMGHQVKGKAAASTEKNEDQTARTAPPSQTRE
jgi:hypothetical protein